MCGEILRSLVYICTRALKLCVCQRGIKARNDYIGKTLLARAELYTRIAKLAAQLFRTDKVHAFSRAVGRKKGTCDVSGGHYLLLTGLKSHAGKALVVKLMVM